MSLRAFHIVFIVVTTALSVWVAAWGIHTYSVDHDAGALALGILFLLTAVALVIYGKKVFRKLKELP